MTAKGTIKDLIFDIDINVWYVARKVIEPI
jgi:hypothetical protein